MRLESSFDKSYKRALGNEREGKTFFEAFYDQFTKDPEVAEKFAHTDMDAQQRMLKKSFYSLFAFYASGQPDYQLERIAISHNHKHLDIRPEFYDRWLECLIQTVRTYDDEFSDEVELAWRLIMTPGITYMKFMYDKDPQ